MVKGSFMIDERMETMTGELASTSMTYTVNKKKPFVFCLIFLRSRIHYFLKIAFSAGENI
jgi:hypothetical protein